MVDKTTKHTPLPWTAEPHGIFPCRYSVMHGERRVAFVGAPFTTEVFPGDDAAFIVRACNNHDDLLEAFKSVMELIDTGYLIRDISKDAEPGFAIRQFEPVRQLQQAVLAIDKAEKTE
ncbi:hypothetical protein LCGC14_0414050 [marine sediment metagenome]|uniref:Uncharacterized protein n=1 Tax=marine sediment metagenome TaxID=412755 RepID=A0A0F9SYV5_9ZZZZ